MVEVKVKNESGGVRSRGVEGRTNWSGRLKERGNEWDCEEVKLHPQT